MSFENASVTKGFVPVNLKRDSMNLPIPRSHGGLWPNVNPRWSV